MVRMVASRVMPALLTMTSTEPNSPRAPARSASTSAELTTSQRTPRATSVPPSCLAAASAAASSTSPSTTRAPSATKSSAMAKPIPCAAPVITAVRPANSGPGMRNSLVVSGLEHGRQPLATADAHGFQAVAGAAASHLVQQRGEDADAGRADRMAERDARSVDVEAIEVGGGEIPFPGHREHLRSERLVQFDQIDVGQVETGSLQGLGGGRYRADAHDLGADPGGRPTDQAGQGAKSQFDGTFLGGDHADGGAVVLTAGVAGGHGRLRVLADHDGSQRGQ